MNMFAYGYPESGHKANKSENLLKDMSSWFHIKHLNRFRGF